MAPRVRPPSHICLQIEVALEEKKNSLLRASGRGFLEKLPTDPACWIRDAHKAPSPAEAPLKTLRHFLFWKQNCPLYSPALPRSSSGISGRQRPQQSPFYRAERQWGQLVLCCSGGWRMQSHQITKTSAVFLLLRTITIGTTSCCYHSNRAVPSTQ